MSNLYLNLIISPEGYFGKYLFLLPSKLLILIEDGDTLTSLSKKVSISSNSVFRKCKTLIKAKLIVKKKVEGKRIKPIQLTKKGIEIQKLMKEIIEFNNEKIQLPEDM